MALQKLIISTFLLVSCFMGLAQSAPISESLIGKHKFGLQFIYDGYGTSEITKDEEGILHFTGEQYSGDKEEFVLLEGVVTVIDERSFTISGNLKLFTKGCCGLLDRKIKYTFRKTGSRTFWRLKEREELCSEYTCSYYLDIFE